MSQIEFKIKQGLLAALVLICCVQYSANAAPRHNYNEDYSAALREMRDNIDQLRHQVNNHESEIRTYEEKLSNQETIIDSLRQQVVELTQANKDLVKDISSNLEMKIGSLETATKGLVADLKQFKTHANDSSTALGQYKQKIVDLERILDTQNHNIENLQSALRSMMDAMQVKSGTIDSSVKTHKVKSGDTLEKIARSYQTTISNLIELNGLANDRIRVGQTLKVP